MKIFIITGGSRGIGASAARLCAARGMGVILTYNTSPSAAEDVVATITSAGGMAVSLKLDVGDADSFPAFREAVAAALRTRFARDDFDFLVNNAGHGLYNPIATVTEAQFDRLVDVHLKGPFFLTQTLLPLMVDGGHIVNLTSATKRVAFVGVAPYAALKGGLEVLTRYMAKEFEDRKIRANSISPGVIRTDLGGGLDAASEKSLSAMIALGRVGEPDDIGGAIASLLSDENRYINAQDIEVSGGYVI